MSRSICFLAALLCAVASAAALCPKDLLTVSQVATGREVEAKTEWRVSIKSKCYCSVSHVTLFCPKFHAGIKVNPDIISIDSDGHCLVSTTNPIFNGDVVEFTYAWDPIDFHIFDFYEACS